MAKKNKFPAGYIEVAKDRYHIRTEANACSHSLGRPKVGDRLPYLEKSGKQWYKIRFNNQIGYISIQAGKAVEVKQTYLTIKKGNWHVRTAPDAKGKSLGVVKGGDKILDQGQTKGTWRLVIFENQNAWIPAKAIVKE